jgi:glycosyltransferase involved in cell wall biosynthesis
MIDSMSGHSRPLVSVLMPAYNAEAYIRVAIQSVLNQTYTDFELIIADDGSSDATAHVVSSFSDIRIVRISHARNIGYAENMNSLFRAARGQYLVIQDADDYCTANRLDVLVSFLDTHTEVDMVGSSYIKVNEFNQEEEVVMPSGSKLIHKQLESLVDPLPILNGTVMFRRKVIDQGVFFRKLRHIDRGQDDDWLFRVSERFTLDNIAQCLYYYRFNSLSMTQDPSKVNYYSLSAAAYVRYLKEYRRIHGVDLQEQNNENEIDLFFLKKKQEITATEPAYLELYIAHKYLSIGKRVLALRWLFKALMKDSTNSFIWKKMMYVLLNKN